MTFVFHSPWFLLLLVPAILLLVIQWYRRPPALVVSSVNHFTGKEGSQSPRLGWLRLPLVLEFAGIILLIVALARPQQGHEVITTIKKGIDIAICLDVSGSMEFFDPEESQSFQSIVDKINDGQLKSRLSIAKEEIARFVDKRPNDRLGLTVFASQPYQLCPLTFDKNLIHQSIEKASVEMLGDYNSGTGIAAPLATAIQRLKDSEAKRRVIILFTDGANNVDQALTPEQAAELAAQFNIAIYTVGIGSPSAVKLAKIRIGFFRSRVTPRPAPYDFDEELMKTLAEKTAGRYFHVKSRQGFTEVMDEIDSLEKVEITQPRQVNFKDLFPAFLYSGICLIGLSFLLNKTVMMRVP